MRLFELFETPRRIHEGSVIDTIGRKMGVKTTPGAPKASQAPRWATHVGQTPAGAYHWLSNETPVETDDSDQYFPLANKTEFTGYMGKRNRAGAVEPIDILGEAEINEKAPPGMEGWIKDRKADFKDQYGDKWEEVLYATAWKQHNEKNESVEEAKSDSLGKRWNKAFWWDGYRQPQDMMAAVKDMDDETLLRLQGKGIDDQQSPGEGTPREFQIKIINRELRRRGYRDFEKYMSEAAPAGPTEQQNNTVSRLEKSGGHLYSDVTLVKGDEVALLGRNGNVRFAIYPNGKFDRAKEFIDFQKNGWELEMKMKKPKKRIDHNAISMFGDIAAGGGDPIDHLMVMHNMSMKEINMLARDQGFKNANDWARSFS